jgi:hemerythrin-like metal-binding protein
MPATDTYRWKEAYSVNIAELDQQHRQLFAIVNELDQALQTGDGGSAVAAVLQKLLDNALIHFAAEESLMEQHAFPGLSTHRAQHEMFRQKMADFLEDHKAAKPGVPVALMFFMQTWLKQHVLKTDKQYSAYLNARGVH